MSKSLAKKYDAINIKLDKAGGLTEALRIMKEAKRCGIGHHGRLYGGRIDQHGAGHSARADR